MEYVTDLARLQEIVGGDPATRSLLKQQDHIDAQAARFLAAAPFYVLATADENGACDATPRGDEPGFALVLDEKTLALPERPGNKRLDSLRNILVNPQVGLLFVIPGLTHTLRVNGTAQIVRDAEFFDRMSVYGKPPLVSIVVTVRDVYFHCSKAFVRSQLWQPETWPAPGTVPTMGSALRGLIGISEEEAAGVDERGLPANRPDMF